MQIISVPNYDFRKITTGQLLNVDADAASSVLDMASVTGFSANQFAILGFDSDLELAEIVQITTVDSGDVELDISNTAYWHEKHNLVYPSPYDQVELYKKRTGGSMQLLARKTMDVDGLETVFVDDTSEEGDTYEYKYRNSISAAVSAAATTGLIFLHQDEPYVTPEQVVEYMGTPTGLTSSDANLVMLCAAYSDLLDHTIGRYQDERLWYHAAKIIIPAKKLTSTYKVRVVSANEKPINEVLEAFIINPKTGKKKAIRKPYEVAAKAIVELSELEDVDFEDTDKLVLIVKVGFFPKEEIPEDIRMLLVRAIAQHIRREDVDRRYIQHSGQLTVDNGVEPLVKMINVGKYRKTYMEAAAEGFGQRVNSKTLRAMKVEFDDAMLKNNKDVFRRYQQTLGFTFL